MWEYFRGGSIVPARKEQLVLVAYHHFPCTEILHIDISPCQRHVLLWIRGNIMIIFNLKNPAQSVIRIVDWVNSFNCGLWMPLSSAYAMEICAGDTLGNMLLCTPNKR